MIKVRIPYFTTSPPNGSSCSLSLYCVLAANYPITLVGCANIDCGISMPSALVVLWLMNNSNVVYVDMIFKGLRSINTDARA